MLNTKCYNDNAVHALLLCDDFFERYERNRVHASQINSNITFIDDSVWFIDEYLDNFEMGREHSEKISHFTSTELKGEYKYIILETISNNSSFNVVEVNNMNSLGNYYQISDSVEVYEFAEQNELVPFLIEAAREIQKVFGNNIVIELEKAIDPELKDDISIFAYIQTDISVDEALSKIDKIEDDWFLENLHRAKGRFNFDVKWV